LPVLGIGRGAAGEGDRGGLGRQRELAVDELVEGRLVLEANELRELLAAGLGAEGGLGDVGVADQLALLVDLAATVGAAEDEAAFADGGEQDVGVALTQEGFEARVSLLHRRQLGLHGGGKLFLLFLVLGGGAASGEDQ